MPDYERYMVQFLRSICFPSSEAAPGEAAPAAAAAAGGGAGGAAGQ